MEGERERVRARSPESFQGDLLEPVSKWSFPLQRDDYESH